MSREWLTFREKQLWWEFGTAAAALAAFLSLGWRLPRNGGWENTLLYFMWVIPFFYSTFKMHSDEMRPFDERDREIDARGDLVGLRLLVFGVVLAVVQTDVKLGTLRSCLFVLLCIAQMLRTALKLRLYAGHEGFLPDRWAARRRARTYRRLAKRALTNEARDQWLAQAEGEEARTQR